MKPTTARSLGAVCAAALFFCLFAIAAQAADTLTVPQLENAKVGNANSATSQQAQAQKKALQQSTAGSTSGVSSRNLNFTTSNTVKGNINAANSAQVNIGGVDLSGRTGGGTSAGGGGSLSGNSLDRLDKDTARKKYIAGLDVYSKGDINSSLKSVSDILLTVDPHSLSLSDYISYADYIANNLTPEDAIWFDVIRSDEQFGKLGNLEPDNSSYAEEAKQVLAWVSNDTHQSLHVKVYDSDQQQAQACSDGTIYVTTGLIKLFEGHEDELYYIFAHEAGHIAADDFYNLLKTSLSLSASLGKQGRLEEVPEKGSIWGLNGGTGAGWTSWLSTMNANIKKQENAADNIAFQETVSRFNNPQTAQSALNRLLTSDVGTSGGADHPSLQERLDASPLKHVWAGPTRN